MHPRIVHLALALSLALLAAALTGCHQPASVELASEAAPDPDRLATVDGVALRTADLERELARLRAAHPGREPEVDRVLADLVERQRLVARARRLGLDQDPEVQRAMQGVLIAKLKERELEPRWQATTESLPKTNERSASSPGAMTTSSAPRPQARLAMLRVEMNPKSSEARLREATLRLENARTAALRLPASQLGFGALAAEYSDDDGTRYQGGDLGWLDEDPAKYHFDAAALAAGFALASVGEVSPVVRGRDGLYLVRLLGRRATPEPPPSQREERVRYQRHREHRQAVEEAFAAETRALIPVQVNTSAVDHFKDRHPPAVESLAGAGVTPAAR